MNVQNQSMDFMPARTQRKLHKILPSRNKFTLALKVFWLKLFYDYIEIKEGLV